MIEPPATGANAAVEPASFALAPKFPAAVLRSHDDFQRFMAEQRGRLDARYEFEQSLATRAASVQRAGTCAVCLRPALFTSSTAQGVKRSDGQRVPNWREEMRCDCAARLGNRQRAVIHLLQASGLMPWMHLLLFGPPADADRKLTAMVASSAVVPRLASTPFTDTQVARHLGVSRSSAHCAVSHDYLHFVPPTRVVLKEIHDALLPGGRFVFTVPFHCDAAVTVPMPREALTFAGAAPGEYRGEPHRFGWDLIELLRGAGFRDAAAYLYWSEELGYLGSMNFVFRAIK